MEHAYRSTLFIILKFGIEECARNFGTTGKWKTNTKFCWINFLERDHTVYKIGETDSVKIHLRQMHCGDK
jgi:hypothetical protein